MKVEQLSDGSVAKQCVCTPQSLPCDFFRSLAEVELTLFHSDRAISQGKDNSRISHYRAGNHPPVVLEQWFQSSINNQDICIPQPCCQR